MPSSGQILAALDAAAGQRGVTGRSGCFLTVAPCIGWSPEIAFRLISEHSLLRRALTRKLLQLHLLRYDD